jgi:hypothetical protein
MKQAFMAIVVDNINCKDLFSELVDSDLGFIKVLAEGNISVSAKDVTTLPNHVWLCQPNAREASELFLVKSDEDIAGRVLKEDELNALRCVTSSSRSIRTPQNTRCRYLPSSMQRRKP